MTPRLPLLAVERMPQIRELDIPESFYLVTDNPAPLAGAIRPTPATPWLSIYRLGIKAIVCLTEDPPGYLPKPLCVAGHFALQDLNHGRQPDDPEHEAGVVQKASDLVAGLIKCKVGVLVHCAGGTGRTGTVIGCVLKGLGYNSADILVYLDQLNRLRGSRSGWPESPWQADMIHSYTQSSGSHPGKRRQTIHD